ncbi:hypothetical protein CSA08_01685 [Candidatus Gracilibacteria bacterium]|nr:MAG: hypothetical protein CSA08_01685 [Candidatus Gracilibacteria bacterium]
MKFKYELYKYQQDVMNVFQNEININNKKIHIVSPPGSGKTIMGIEMITRLKGNSLILVPNITLQHQWKDKIEKFFLEENENINELVSIDKENIKKINILTYQSLTQTNRENDDFLEQIFDFWFKDFSIDFEKKEDFLSYVNYIKDFDNKKYINYLLKYKKKLKKNIKEDNLEKLISPELINYFGELKKFKIDSIILDEAHHLTNWWSKVIYFLWEFLSEKAGEEDNSYIIGLTTTPPYENIDFFELDDNYLNLLGEIDYYVPTPSIIKSGRLAPFSDLVYFVEPDKNLSLLIKKN